MPKAKKLPSGSWRVQVYAGMENGKQKLKSFTAPTKTEAEYLAAQWKRTHKTIDNPTKLTLSEAIDEYIASKSNILSPSTIRGYRCIQRNSLQSLMHKRIYDIDSKTLQTAVNIDAKKHGEKTLRNAVGLVKTVIGINIPERQIAVQLPQKTPYEPVVVSPSQMKILFDAMRGTSTELPALLAMWEGLRASEIVGLRWSDYNAKTKVLKVHTAIVPNEEEKYVEKGTKTEKSTRTIVLSPYLCELLNNTPKTSEFIFAVKPPTIRKRLQAICVKAGLPKIRLHDLRHANASVMLLLGIPQKYAMERGGWSTAQTMETIYQHTFAEEKEIVDKKIDDFFTRLLLS